MARPHPKKAYHPDLPSSANGKKLGNCEIETVATLPSDMDEKERDYCELIFEKKRTTPRVAGKPDTSQPANTCYYYIYIPVDGGYERICIPYECH